MSYLLNLEKAKAEAKAALLGLLIAANDHDANGFDSVSIILSIDADHYMVDCAFECGVLRDSVVVPSMGGSL